MRRELRTESLAQLRDVASMFVQTVKSNRVAHAEVQTSILDVPAPTLLPSLLPGGVSVGVGPSSSAPSAAPSSSHDSLAAPSQAHHHRRSTSTSAARVAGRSEGGAAPASASGRGREDEGTVYTDSFESVPHTADDSGGFAAPGRAGRDDASVITEEDGAGSRRASGSEVRMAPRPMLA